MTEQQTLVSLAGSVERLSRALDEAHDDLSRDPRETLASVSRDLQTLSDAGLVVLYNDPEHPRRSLLFVRQWSRHQKIDRPSKGHGYPIPTGEMLDEHDTRAMCASPSRDTRANAAPGAGESTHASHLLVAGDEKAKSNPTFHRPEPRCLHGRAGACGDCADDATHDVDHRHGAIARRQEEQQALAELTRTEIDDCPMCDDRGYRGSRVCSHDPDEDDRRARGIAQARAQLEGKAS